jgi:hypothetical protein
MGGLGRQSAHCPDCCAGKGSQQFRVLIPFFDPILQEPLVDIRNAGQLLVPIRPLLTVFAIKNENGNQRYQQGTSDN